MIARDCPMLIRVLAAYIRPIRSLSFRGACGNLCIRVTGAKLIPRLLFMLHTEINTCD